MLQNRFSQIPSAFARVIPVTEAEFLGKAAAFFAQEYR
jgi:hypothetical protein